MSARTGRPGRQIFVGLLCRNTLILLALAVSVQGQSQAALLFQEGQKAQRSGDILHAYLLFARAAVLEPANMAIAQQKNKTEMLLSSTSTVRDATTDLDPDLAFLRLVETEGPGQYDEFGPTAPAPHLKSSGVKKSFDLNGDSKTNFQKVADTFGIQLMFDNDFQGPLAFQFHTGELDMFEAFRLLEAMTTSLVIPVNEKTAMVVRDTPQRRTELLAVETVAIPIPERMVVQDAQEIVTAVQQALEIRRAQVDPGRHMVFMRDSASKVLLARQLFTDLSRLRAQVEIEVELLTVSKHSSMGIGLALPNSSALVNFGSFLQKAASPAGFAQFLGFGGGKTLFGLGVTEAQAFATLSKASAQSLLSAQVVALDGQPASLNVGSRFPVATAQFLGTTAQATPTPTVTFQDLGLVLKITPTVHQAGEMTLDIDAAFNTLGPGGISGIPSIEQRKFQGKVRLIPGEWAVIAGLTATDDATTSTGIAGLAGIPVLGHLFRSDTITNDSDQTLVVLKPRIVNLPPWDFPVTTREVGTEGRFISFY